MRDRKEVDQKRLRSQDRIHAWLELRQYGLEHLIDVSWVEVALCCFGDIEIHRCEVDRMPCQLVGVREEFVVQSVIERSPRYPEVIYVQTPVATVDHQHHACSTQIPNSPDERNEAVAGIFDQRRAEARNNCPDQNRRPGQMRKAYT